MPRSPDEVYAEIAAWPLEERLRLAARILETGAAELAGGVTQSQRPPAARGADTHGEAAGGSGADLQRPAPSGASIHAPDHRAPATARISPAAGPQAHRGPATAGSPSPSARGSGEPRSLIVVDGSNFLGTVTGFDLASEAARDELITRLQDFAHDHPIYRVLVYFDGQKTTVKRAGSVEIRFTPGQKPADFYIVETLRALDEAERQRALLVTADRALADAARKLGAKVEAPSSFHRRLAGARRTSIGERGLSAAEVADWEAYFQQPPDQGKKPGKPGSRG